MKFANKKTGRKKCRGQEFARSKGSKIRIHRAPAAAHRLGRLQLSRYKLPVQTVWQREQMCGMPRFRLA